MLDWQRMRMLTIYFKLFHSGSTVKAGGKRVAKKSYEESHATHHVNPEREHKVPKPRYSSGSPYLFNSIRYLMNTTQYSIYRVSLIDGAWMMYFIYFFYI